MATISAFFPQNSSWHYYLLPFGANDRLCIDTMAQFCARLGVVEWRWRGAVLFELPERCTVHALRLHALRTLSLTLPRAKRVLSICVDCGK